MSLPLRHIFCALLGLLLWVPVMASPTHGFTTGSLNLEAAARIKTHPAPLQANDGTLFISVVSPERAPLRWPVLRFANTVRENFAQVFAPLGSISSPLTIELGASTNRIETIERRSMRTTDGFSQLIIHVPNPETVDLDILRTAIIEALLRERARAEASSYADFTWPKWFLAAAVDASRGNVWKAEAYERLIAAGTTPETPGWRLEDFFNPQQDPPREVAAFFAHWLFQRVEGDASAQRIALITTPWEPRALLGDATNEIWQGWLMRQSGVLFLPGTLTQSQFTRWAAQLAHPTDAADAMAHANRITRFAIGRPQPFRDLSELYLRAYAAYAIGKQEQYTELRAAADEAKTFLEAHLRKNPVLKDDTDSLTPVPTR